MSNYTETVWINGAAPPISASNLQKIETGIDTAHSELQDHLDDISDAHDASAISNVAAGGILATTVQAAIDELDTEKVAKSGDTMTSTLIIDPTTDIPALKIVPASDTATTKFMIQGRNAADDADKFTVDNAGNIVTVTNVDGVDVSTHDHTGVAGHGVVLTAGSVTNVPAGNISSVTIQAAIDELDTEKVAKAGDTMTNTLVIDPATDVPALQIIPASDTATTKFMIQGRNAANDADKFTIDNAGNIVTVGTVDGADISAHAHTGADGTVVVNAATLSVVDSTSATTWPVIVDTVTGSLAAKTDAGLTYNASTANLATTTFTGALAGNAATATLAATLSVVDSTSATTWPVIVDTVTGSLAAKTDAGLTYNASTANLATTTFTGALAGNAATATLAATSTVIDSTSATTWPTIVDTVTGSLAIKTDAGLTYNAETANLATTTFTGALAGNATTSTNTTGNAATVTVADAASATTTYPLLGTAVSGSLSPKTDTGLTYNADTNALTATTFVGAVTGASSLNVLKAGDTMGGNLTFSNAQKIIGGTATTADLTLQTTTGVGEAGADMHFLVGNNGATEAVTILNNGNIGIGTANPNYKLDVTGFIRTQGSGSFTEDSGIGLYAISDVYKIGFDSVGSTKGYIRYNVDTVASTHGHIFSAGALATPTPLMLIRGDGNVGIGTTAPATKLDVVGAMQVSSAVALSLGGYVRTFAEATGTPAGTTTYFDIAVDVPVGCKLLGAQLRVDTALTAGETWGAAYVTGSTTALAAAGTAVAQNTKVSKMHVDEITTDTTKVRITRDAGNFTDATGVIRAIVYFEQFTAMGNAA